MSIWCSHDHIGTESWVGYHVSSNVIVAYDGTGPRPHGRRVRHQTQGGHVRAYREGFGNHYPDGTDPVATICLAHVAPWCVPGHDEACCGGHDYPDSGEWLRLDVDSPDALTWWDTDADGNPTPAPAHASVVLDEDAARALAADLLAWADGPRVRRAEK